MPPKIPPATNNTSSPTTASLRWDILRRAFLSRPPPGGSSEISVNCISRRTRRGFNLIPWHLDVSTTEESKPKDTDGLTDVHVTYKLPVGGTSTLVLVQRAENHVDLKDFDVSHRYNIDSTGLVCQWPSEDVLAYFCLTHAEIFRSKKILELGSGYGLAGLAIAASTDASEIVISDGNPQVVDYIQRNILGNAGAFGHTKVQGMALHWNEEVASDLRNTFDIIIASDCTFFKEFHNGLAFIVKALLKPSESSEALFFSPKRGNSLDRFLQKVEEIGLKFSIQEKYENKVWELHTSFLNGSDSSWPNYDKDHCYPLLIRITL
ncbi:calmodulin-lysine N-methyltransferase [Aristolochia californica]|uniref:calmodulin-lysine N-methyltransferase n=1 Tax=Aristolochia californica TaxID=171875 RepID=UPI0035DA4627